MQFGTSRFLQAHVDLFVSEAMRRGDALGPIAVVQTTGSAESRRRIEGFRSLRPFPVYLRGLSEGVTVDRRVDVGSVATAWHADQDWADVVAQFVSQTRIVVCNTGDRGWELDPRDHAFADPPRSFPAKLLHLLRARFRAGADPLVLLPCELITANGTTLRQIVVDLAGKLGDEPALLEWLQHRCIWVNSLVDRIVSEALEPVGAIAEPYALWAIAAQPDLITPCTHPDMRVVAELLPYERPKLFILNLGHTVLAERWLADCGVPEMTVADAVVNETWRAQLLDVYQREVLPVFAALGMAAEAVVYRDAVVDRFANPFLRHYLPAIAQNHASKKQRRIAPLLELGEQYGAARGPVLSRMILNGGIR